MAFREAIVRPRALSTRGLALSFVGLEVVDSFLTMWATSHGYEEVNPLAAPIAQTWLFPTWKIAGAVAAVMILMPLARRFPGSVNYGLVAVSLFLGAVLVSNFVAMVT